MESENSEREKNMARETRQQVLFLRLGGDCEVDSEDRKVGTLRWRKIIYIEKRTGGTHRPRAPVQHKDPSNTATPVILFCASRPK